MDAWKAEIEAMKLLAGKWCTHSEVPLRFCIIEDDAPKGIDSPTEAEMTEMRVNMDYVTRLEEHNKTVRVRTYKKNGVDHFELIKYCCCT